MNQANEGSKPRDGRFSFLYDVIKSKIEAENILIIDVKWEIMRQQLNPNYAVLGTAERGSAIGGSAVGRSDGSAPAGGAMASPAESLAPGLDPTLTPEPLTDAKSNAEDSG